MSELPSPPAPSMPDARLSLPSGWIQPSLGAGVGALMTARSAGHSSGPYASCNLGDHVDDSATAVARNRASVAGLTRARHVWLTQVHGHRVVRLSTDSLGQPQPEADGAVCTEPGVACTVMVADCLPVLLAAPQGRGVAALHAGWRGLAGAGDMAGRGILETGVDALCEAAGCDPGDLRAWLGPCIGPSAFEVGADVLKAFGVDPDEAHPRFAARPPHAGEAAPRWLADLAGLARDRLAALRLVDDHIGGGRWCTVSAPSRFFSFRRDAGRTGRQAACIWLERRS
ncbi:MAG: peptidoglycan editing factor PgeF [Aquabacterium sp.]